MVPDVTSEYATDYMESTEKCKGILPKPSPDMSFNVLYFAFATEGEGDNCITAAELVPDAMSPFAVNELEPTE